MGYMKKKVTGEVRDDLRLNLKIVARFGYPVVSVDNPRCDFCGGGNPVIIYGAKQMSNGTKIRCWRWSACAPCERAVDEGDWRTLEDRGLKMMERLFGEAGKALPAAQVRLALRRSLAKFPEEALIEGEGELE